ncbi:MAG: insulinase family protein [Planctomycetota bacterium]|nr:insulinase family protein [Planctomycetota bacterium]
MPARKDRTPVTVHRLPNGLSVLLERMEWCSSAAVGLAIGVGSRDEPAEMAGASHLLEHMAFKGTKRRDSFAINADMDAMGAQGNAFTCEEYTAYYMWVVPERLPEAMEFLADMMEPTLPEEELEREKEVVIEEIAMYEDLPECAVEEALMRAAFGRHPLARRIVGTAGAVSRIGRRGLARFRERSFRAGDMCCVVTGNFDGSRALRDIRRLCGRWPAGSARRRRQPPIFRPGIAIERRKGLLRQHAALAVPSEPLRSPGAIAARMAAAALGGCPGSRLYWALEDKGLADSVGAWYEGYSDGGLICAAFAADPGKVGECFRIAMDELGGIREGITADELARARKQIEAGLLFSSETPMRRLMRHFENWNARRRALSVEEELAGIEAVTTGDVRRALERWSAGLRPAAAAVGPLRRPPLR